jgi:hypothetical protein
MKLLSKAVHIGLVLLPEGLSGRPMLMSFPLHLVTVLLDESFPEWMSLVDDNACFQPG